MSVFELEQERVSLPRHRCAAAWMSVKTEADIAEEDSGLPSEDWSLVSREKLSGNHPSQQRTQVVYD